MKSFSFVALLPAIAFARGDNTGLNANDAITTELMDNITANLTLNTYNSDNSGTDEFHGDLTLVLKEGGFSTSFQEFGFCIEQETDGTVFWDCMDVFTGLLPKEIDEDELYSSNFDVRDTYAPLNDITALPSTFNLIRDDDQQEEGEIADQSLHWKQIEARSYKSCELDASVDADQQPADDQQWKIVSCSAVNVHFYRNFETDQVSQDAQINLEDEPIKGYKVVGFIRRHNLQDYSDAAQYIFGDVVTFEPVSADYKALFTSKDDEETVDDKDEEASEDTDDTTDDENSTTPEEDGAEEGDVNADDSAMKMSASLMTLGLASVYALLA